MSGMNDAQPDDQPTKGSDDLLCPQCQLGQLNSRHCKRTCELSASSRVARIFPAGVGRIRFGTTARETRWTLGCREGTDDLGWHGLKRPQQVNHQWSEVATLALADGLHFFAASSQHISCFTIAAQFDEHLPQHMVRC